MRWSTSWEPSAFSSVEAVPISVVSIWGWDAVICLTPPPPPPRRRPLLTALIVSQSWSAMDPCTAASGRFCIWAVFLGMRFGLFLLRITADFSVGPAFMEATGISRVFRGCGHSPFRGGGSGRRPTTATAPCRTAAGRRTQRPAARAGLRVSQPTDTRVPADEPAVPLRSGQHKAPNAISVAPGVCHRFFREDG